MGGDTSGGPGAVAEVVLPAGDHELDVPVPEAVEVPPRALGARLGAGHRKRGILPVYHATIL